MSSIEDALSHITQLERPTIAILFILEAQESVAKLLPNRAERLMVHSMVYQSTLAVEGMQVTSPKAWRIIADTLRENKVQIIRP